MGRPTPRDDRDPRLPARAVRPGRRLQPRLGRRGARADRALVRRLPPGRRALRRAAPRPGPDRPPATRRLARADAHRLCVLAPDEPAVVDALRREPARHDAGRPRRARRVLPAQQHAAGLTALPGARAGHGRAALDDRAAALRLPGDRRGRGPGDVRGRALPAREPDRPLDDGRGRRGAALRGEQPVLLLQRPVLLPDRRDRDGHGDVLPAHPGVRQPTGVAVVAAAHGPGVPGRARDHAPPHQLDHAGDSLGPRDLLLARPGAPTIPADRADRRDRHRPGGVPGRRSSPRSSSTT